MASLVENANRIQTDKEAIRQALIAKGVEVAETVSLDDYAGLIEGISAGGVEILKSSTGTVSYGSSFTERYTAEKKGKIIVTACASHYSSPAQTSVEVEKNSDVLTPSLTYGTASGSLKPRYNQYVIDVEPGDVITTTIQHTGPTTAAVMPYLYSIIG